MNAIPAMNRLIGQFEKLPGIGAKTAQKMAYYVLGGDRERAKEFADALNAARESIHYCARCHNFTDREICDICADKTRDGTLICVVEQPGDVETLERMKDYHGVYHVLHGLISPLDGVGPEELTVKPLLERVANEDVKEVIMATNPSVEGQTTALYIAKLLKPFGVRVTALALGIPVGGSLEYADAATLSSSIENRREI